MKIPKYTQQLSCSQGFCVTNSEPEHKIFFTNKIAAIFIVHNKWNSKKKSLVPLYYS